MKLQHNLIIQFSLSPLVLVWFLISFEASSLVGSFELLHLALLMLLAVTLLLGHFVVQLNDLHGLLPIQISEDNVFKHWDNCIGLVFGQSKVG